MCADIVGDQLDQTRVPIFRAVGIEAKPSGGAAKVKLLVAGISDGIPIRAKRVDPLVRRVATPTQNLRHEFGQSGRGILSTELR